MVLQFVIYILVLIKSIVKKKKKKKKIKRKCPWLPAQVYRGITPEWKNR